MAPRKNNRKTRLKLQERSALAKAAGKGVGVNGNLVPPVKGEVRNPTGKPKGTKHVSTWIQELLNDEEFTATVRQGLEVIKYKGAPMKAIIQAQLHLAANGDTKAFDVLLKHGYGTKQIVEVSNPAKEILDKFGLGDTVDAGQDT